MTPKDRTQHTPSKLLVPVADLQHWSLTTTDKPLGALLGRKQRTGDEALVREVLKLEISHADLLQALQQIADSFTEQHKATLKEWEGSGTEALTDEKWNEAAWAKHYSDIARAAIAKATKA